MSEQSAGDLIAILAIMAGITFFLLLLSTALTGARGAWEMEGGGWKKVLRKMQSLGSE